MTLTRKQAVKLEKDRVHAIVQLGDLDKARRVLEAADLEPEYKHFMVHNIDFQAGDIAGSERELKMAEDSLNDRSPLIIRMEIALNKGVMLVGKGDYLSADEQFERARRIFEEEGFADKEVLFCLYENMTINKARIGEPYGGRAAGEELLKEYGGKLDPDNPYDSISLLNTRLSFLRQVGASRSELNAHVNSAFEGEGLTGRFDASESFLMAVSIARITLMNGLDPKKALSYLGSHIRDADGLGPGDRLAAMQEIASVAACLPDELLESYPSLIARLDGYSLDDATADLRAHSAALPEEAVLARYKCLKDRAMLALASGRDTAECKHRMIGCLEEAIGLLERSGLRFPELDERVNVACELLESVKASPDEKEKDRRRALEHIRIAEDRLGDLQSHPFTSVIHIGMSWAYALLGRHEECRGHYEAFKELGVPAGHYALVVKQREFKVAISLRAYAFRAAVLNVRENAEELREEVAEWFSGYESHDGWVEAALLAKFLDVGEIAHIQGKPWLASPAAVAATTHSFLPMPGLGLIFDVTTHGVEDDPVVFSASSYPLGLPIYDEVLVAERLSGILLPVVGASIDLEGLVADQGSVHREVYRLICAHAPSFTPTIDELKSLYADAFGPVTFPDDR